MSTPTIYAVFTFFKMHGCGPCNNFKGDIYKNGKLVGVNEDSAWELLTSDPELKSAGIEFILFEFGKKVDPNTGKTLYYPLPDVYAERVKSAPYLDLRVPTDMVNSHRYTGHRDYKSVKNWMLAMLDTPQFRNYRDMVNQGNASPENRATVTQMASSRSNVPPPVRTTEVQQFENSNNAPVENQAANKSRSKFLPANY